ncbi:ABC transporter ATP-binding protein [Chakrabartyella piscis]|uniref:ABC transporter ATP-binding protein n=1 Tax=Chakrabartyella piscis TaxID=2918914 RepID=UPI002958C26A|nr:ABC transporter ATP-binding protein [Chakrabartyella piscis]
MFERMVTHMLQIKGLKKQYQNHIVLQDVSLHLEKGERLGILGDNGSGKSTLMSILAGVQTADAGEILFCGAPITRETRRKISYIPQEAELLEDLTVKDNLQLWIGIYGLQNPKKVIQEIPAFLNIEPMLHQKIKNLSGGMKKKVSIAIAIMNHPEMIIMDEALSALDAKTVEAVLSYLKQEKSITLFYCSHNFVEVEAICNRLVVLQDGVIAYETTDVSENSKKGIEQLYLNGR